MLHKIYATKSQLPTEIKILKLHNFSLGFDLLTKIGLFCFNTTPIIQVWSQVKGYVGDNNTTFKLDDVKQLFLDGLDRVTADNWTNYDNHTQKEEDNMWEQEAHIDQLHENFAPIVIFPFEDQQEADLEQDFNDEDFEE